MRTIARQVGPYEILRVIGRGGMAMVYLARQTDLDRLVALKELTLIDGSDPQLARRFLREARLIGSLSHPNIVTVHDYVEDHGTPYIAMEFLPRGSVRPYVGRMSLAQIGSVLEGVLGGLAHAGDRGIVHRDLKPENILVTGEGWVKVADFGIAKAVSTTQTEASLTTAGTTLGTPRYMAPERAMGQEVGPWSDLYSLGVIVFEMLVGRTPFQDTDAPMAILMRQINDPIPPVSSLVPDVDPAISDWVERLLAKEPTERTRSASTAWDELDDILSGLLGAHWLRGAALPATPGEPAPSSSRLGAPGAGRQTVPATAPMGSSEATASRPPGIAMTVAPETLLLDGEPEPSGRRRRHGLPVAARVALAVAAVIAVILAAMLGGGGSGSAGGSGGASPAGAQGQPSSAPGSAGGAGDSTSDDPSDDAPDTNGN